MRKVLLLASVSQAYNYVYFANTVDATDSAIAVQVAEEQANDLKIVLDNASKNASNDEKTARDALKEALNFV